MLDALYMLFFSLNVHLCEDFTHLAVIQLSLIQKQMFLTYDTFSVLSLSCFSKAMICFLISDSKLCDYLIKYKSYKYKAFLMATLTSSISWLLGIVSSAALIGMEDTNGPDLGHSLSLRSDLEESG